VEHAKPEVGRHRFDLDPEPLQLDLGAPGVLEEADAVAEQDRLDEHQDLVQLPQLEAAARQLGAEHADVLLPRRRPGQGDRPGRVIDELDVGRRLGGRVVGDDELPPKAPSFSASPRLGSSPPQVRRPTNSAPTRCGSAAAALSSPPMNRVSQDMSPPGPAMKPSRDMVAE
jgi:hypothetical protein